MTWRSTVLILTAFIVAAGAVWYAPGLLRLLGLGEFVFVGQAGMAILALSVTEAVFRMAGDHVEPLSAPTPIVPRSDVVKQSSNVP